MVRRIVSCLFYISAQLDTNGVVFEGADSIDGTIIIWKKTGELLAKTTPAARPGDPKNDGPTLRLFI